jgi:hypothetical protein
MTAGESFGGVIFILMLWVGGTERFDNPPDPGQIEILEPANRKEKEVIRDQGNHQTDKPGEKRSHEENDDAGLCVIQTEQAQLNGGVPAEHVNDKEQHTPDDPRANSDQCAQQAVRGKR